MTLLEGSFFKITLHRNSKQNQKSLGKVFKTTQNNLTNFCFLVGALVFKALGFWEGGFARVSMGCSLYPKVKVLRGV